MIEIFARCIRIVTKDGQVIPLDQSKNLEMANKTAKESLGKLMLMKKALEETDSCFKKCLR